MFSFGHPRRLEGTIALIYLQGFVLKNLPHL